MIEITNVTKRYGRRVALSGVSLTLRPGDITLLLGANGAGKSTLLRCLLGITDFEGSIRVATNPYALAVGIIWGMFLGLLVGLIAGTGLGVVAGAGLGPSSPRSTGPGSTGSSRAASGACSSPVPPCWS